MCQQKIRILPKIILALTYPTQMSKFGFDKVKVNLNKVMVDLPKVISNLNLNYFLASFRNQAWESSRWKEVNRRIPDKKEYLYPAKPKASSRTNPILIRTGTLRRTVASSLREASATRIRFVVDTRATKGTKE